MKPGFSPSELAPLYDQLADLLVIGDSTDKLWVLAGCSAALPEEEQCDYGNMGIPHVNQIPHNMRPYICDEPGSCATQSLGACCATPQQCCMTTMVEAVQADPSLKAPPPGFKV